jgi:type II secretion system protein J
MNRRRRLGFTLFELLTVIAVLGVVSTVGMRAFVIITGEWNTTTRRMALNTEAVRIFDSMKKDFGQVPPVALSGVSMQGEERLESNQRYNLVRLEDDYFLLPVAGGAEAQSGAGIRMVKYHIGRKPGRGPRLLRTSWAAGGTPAAGVNLEISGSVLAMRVAFYDGAAWQPEWRLETLPEAVAVSLTLADPERPWEQISRKAVFPVYVN